MITQEELKKVLIYDPDTGIFTNRVMRNSRSKAGDVCGSLKTDGYLRVSINSKRYSLHRLSFLYMEGYLPEYDVDHKNGIRDDNRWCNLRHVSQFCNMQNCKSRTDNSSGFSGVSWFNNRSKWWARAEVGGKHIHLGLYSSPLEAALARLTWEVQCSKWHCDCRGILVQQIQEEWPQFNLKSIGQ